MSSTQEFASTYSTDNPSLTKRFERTIQFLNKHAPKQANVLDLGIPNMLAEQMKLQGYSVSNTKMGQDLDLDYEVVRNPEIEVVTAFEIFEHLVAPFNLLRAIKAPYLIASVPMNLWFARAYWNEKDPWDRHYHEFEDRQFDMLLEKAGWTVKASEKWNSYSKLKLGIRPILRRFTPRYYIVYCERTEGFQVQ
ncbi:MAG TPA: methyltransferase [Cytophagales bacterium]|nr:methyltransferase [Cytophagales bacterium]HAA18807.1 methyltransferase [Cytophagales bacterium]HAP64363.1 methyltransferase [Cytophagales bacterium]